MTITILGLGPGSIDDLTLKAWRALEVAKFVYLRTNQHPCVPDLPEGPLYQSFDYLYEKLDQFDQVYEAICDKLIELAETEDLIYAVPGDPFVAESSTLLLRKKAQEKGIEVEIISGLSFIEPMLSLIGLDALSGLQLLDALESLAFEYHPPINPQFPALIAQVYSPMVASQIKLTLMNQYPDEWEVTLIHGAGTAQQRVEVCPLYEIDHSQHIDLLTSLFVPAKGPLSSFEAFQNTIAHLRSPEGCPWDRKQSHTSLAPYLLEETYEVLEAIEQDDPDALMYELGDLMLQIVLHTQIATEEGEFYMTDVIENHLKKLIRRHPHVWGSVAVEGAEEVVSNWDDIKREEAAEKGIVRESALDGVPATFPALMTAHKYQAKAAKLGFDWDTIQGVEEKLLEELNEIKSERDIPKKIAEIGDLIFVLVNYIRWLGDTDAESVLRRTNAKFYNRFRFVEEQVQAQGDKPMQEYSLAELDVFWDQAKLLEKEQHSAAGQIETLLDEDDDSDDE